MPNLLIVGLGGGVGAICRYLVSLIPVKPGFPILTLCTNFLGAVLIGFITGLALGQKLDARWTLFWKTGVCGGFTTFSTFSLEAVQLFDKGRCAAGGLYIAASVCFCLAGVLLGQVLSEKLS